jgi:hypothetical protein
VQVHRQDSVGTGASDQVRDELGSDRRPPFVLAILTSIAVIRDYGSDSRSAGALARIDHDEQLHQIVIDRRACRLDEVHISTSNIFFDFAKVLAIWEFAKLDCSGLQMQEIADLFGQLGICSPAENL